MKKENKYFLLFELLKYRFALDVLKITRIIRAVAITPLPNAPDIVLGVINFHGTVIPVIDIRKRFGYSDKKLSINDFMIISKVKNLSIALIVDNIFEAIEISTDKIIDKKNVLPGIPHIEGVLKLEGDIIYINDLSKLLSLEEEEEIYTLLKKLDAKEKPQKIQKTSLKSSPPKKKTTKKKTGTKRSRRPSKKR